MRLSPIWNASQRRGELAAAPQPITLDQLLEGGPWEVELGYGKGRYLLDQARQRPDERFLGIEVVSKYYRLLTRRSQQHQVQNLLNIRGEALYILATLLPRAFAERLHVYFPDPWPKLRHHRRRLFDPETVDAVLGVLRPGGELCFATDHLEYGEKVMEILERYPRLRVEPVLTPWPDGARTNYEAKYMREGRPILRLKARLALDAPTQAGSVDALHPAGELGLTSAWFRRLEDA